MKQDYSKMDVHFHLSDSSLKNAATKYYHMGISNDYLKNMWLKVLVYTETQIVLVHICSLLAFLHLC